MQTNMLQSIQDYAKKINSSISILDCLSILITILVMVGFLVYVREKREDSFRPLVYTVGKEVASSPKLSEARPFASKNGKTYTFLWCGGSSNIKAANKIYFNDEYAAQASGRTLSKLCSQ